MAESVPRLNAQDPSERINEALLASGAVIVEDFIGAGVLARFNAEIDVYLQSDEVRELVNPLVTAFFGNHTRHITGVSAKSPTFVEEVLCHPVLMAACDAVLLPSCARYQLNLAHVLDRGPGAELQLLHRDELVWIDFPEPHPELQLASIVALQDFSAENGATRLVPGSHRWDRKREPQFEELAIAEMPAGAAVIYLGSTIHAGGPNTTESTRRRGMHLSYTLGWLRTEENHYLSTPPDIARTLPRKAQELLGYAAHDAILKGGGYLGAVDVGDPIELLAQGKL
jgi:ectoine hydroxylase-related dioxygenase (phytanoyl-CoA dioxygenase family)